MKKSTLSDLKKTWFKKNFIAILLAILVVLILFTCCMIFHNIIFAIIAIILEFLAFFYFRNKLSAYIEKNIDKK